MQEEELRKELRKKLKGKEYTEMNKLYCIVYRTGGKENFWWKRSLPDIQENIISRANEMRREGYHCLVVDYNASINIGLPETYE